eukprot:1922520-Pleurochrysis_carterae.AAC.1
MYSDDAKRRGAFSIGTEGVRGSGFSAKFYSEPADRPSLSFGAPWILLFGVRPLLKKHQPPHLPGGCLRSSLGSGCMHWCKYVYARPISLRNFPGLREPEAVVPQLIPDPCIQLYRNVCMGEPAHDS